jgi:hypothetical protein
LTVGSLTIEGIRATAREVPRAVDVHLRVPAELEDWRFRKAPVYLPAASRTVRLRMSPGSGAAFGWVPASMWTAGQPDLAEFAVMSVSFGSCPDRTATYFGGILAAAPDTCVRFDVSDGRSTTTIAQRLDGEPLLNLRLEHLRTDLEQRATLPPTE